MGSIIGFARTREIANRIIESNSSSGQIFFIEPIDEVFVVKCNIDHTEVFQEELDNMFKE